MKNFFKKLFCSDSWSKNFSETVRRVGKNNAGFSLVELIVVIAIMAILAAVAVVGVSVYIPKAQKAGDQQTVNDVIDAMNLYYYSNPEGVAGGYVVLGPDGVVEVDNNNDRANSFGAAALELTFGAKWETELKLQYSDWQGMTATTSYKDTSYIGNEGELLGTVDKLTSALGDFVKGGSQTAENLMGGEFGQFLDDYDIDRNNGKAIGNAAVLYVAQDTKDMEDEIINGFNTGLQVPVDINDPDAGIQVVFNLYGALKAEGVGDAAALAAVYAYAEGYAQATGQADLFHEKTKFEDVTDTTSVLNQMGACFNSLERDQFSTYAMGQGNKDLQGYIDMMDTVDQNKEIVSGNLNSEDCFTDGKIENVLKGHAAMSNMSVTTQNGQIAIIFTVDENGETIVHVAPLNWDK